MAQRSKKTSSFALAIFTIKPYNFFMSQAFHLFQLQKIDSQIDQMTSRIIEIQQFLDRDERLQTAQKALDEKQDTLRKSQLHLKHIEQDVAEKRAKLEQSENNLYSGRVHIPKELQDIQNEVASLKRIISGLEDKQLETMVTVESHQAEVADSQIDFNKAEAAVAADQASLRGELQRNKTIVERLNVEKNLLIKQISSDNITLYERLRKSRKNIAVAAVVDSTCSACGSTLTPADCQAAKSPQNIFFCPSCGRIVYGG